MHDVQFYFSPFARRLEKSPCQLAVCTRAPHAFLHRGIIDAFSCFACAAPRPVKSNPLFINAKVLIAHEQFSYINTKQRGIAREQSAEEVVHSVLMTL